MPSYINYSSAQFIYISSFLLKRIVLPILFLWFIAKRIYQNNMVAIPHFVEGMLTACFGRTSNNNIFIYEMCRLRKDSRLEFVITKISRYDRYIKIYINAFKLCPTIESVYSLKDYDSTNYEILPNSGREMWIDVSFNFLC